MFRKILLPFYIVYLVIVFFTGLVVVCTFALVLGFINTPATRKALHSIIRCWARITALLAGMPVKITGRKPIGRHILVANHISYLDAVTLFAARPDYFRALGKIELAKAPLFGFLYKRAVILVDRSSPESRSASMLRMQHFLKEEGNIFIFPEGTFNETGNPLKEFYDGAFRLAIVAQTPILPLIFPDTLERWHYKDWWTIGPGKNRAIYLEPVYTAGMTMEDLPKLKQQVYTLMEAALIKYRTV